MARFFSLLRGFEFQNHKPNGDVEFGGDFEPMNDVDLARVQGGFDEETDPPEEIVSEGGEEPTIEPVSGEVVDDQIDGI